MEKKDKKQRDIVLSQDNALTTARYKFAAEPAISRLAGNAGRHGGYEKLSEADQGTVS